MVKIQVNVMAHVSREELYLPLAKRLNEETASVRVFVDDGTLGRWGNGRRCLLNYYADTTHVLVIQDDALPAADLIAGLKQWLPLLPDTILSLYSGKLAAWRTVYDRHAQPPCWLQMEQLQWGVGTVWPTKYIPALVKKADAMTRIDNFDMRLSEANIRTNKLPVIYCAPSWVQHAHTPSTVPGRLPNRHALHALTQEQSALDWARPDEAPVIRVPDFNRRRAGGRQYYGGRS